MLTSPLRAYLVLEVTYQGCQAGGSMQSGEPKGARAKSLESPAPSAAPIRWFTKVPPSAGLGCGRTALRGSAWIGRRLAAITSEVAPQPGRRDGDHQCHLWDHRETRTHHDFD